jgi:preprotein translocase SecY subunit
MFRRLLLAFSDKELRNKILSVVGLLIIARLLAQIPIPILRAQDISTLIDSDAVFNLLNTVAGGAYGKLSFVMLGVGPYITATIVMQLLGVIVPSINRIQKEDGEQGRNLINRWTRIITVPLAALNAWGILQFLASGNTTTTAVISLPPELTNSNVAVSFPYWFVVILSLVAGSIIMMWLGEIITEIKMGNGISLLILSGIVVRIPEQTKKFFEIAWPNFVDVFKKIASEPTKLFTFEGWQRYWVDNVYWTSSRNFLTFIFVFLFTLFFVIFINDAVRKLVVIYSRRGHTEGKSRTMDSVKADLPLKVNMAGVLPIIFAVSFILFPSILSRFFMTANIPELRNSAVAVETYLSSQDKQNNIKPLNLPKQDYIGFAFTQNKEEIDSKKSYDPTTGQELFGFTLTTQSDVENSFFEGTPLEHVKIPFTDNQHLFKFKGTNFGFLPQFTVRWNGVLAYYFFYFLLIIFFTYFYTSTIAFKTDEVSENLQKSGAYIPGVRPGAQTIVYLDYVSNRLNLAGSLFLALIAILPFFFSRQIDFLGQNSSLSGVVGGTTMLILVSVTIETLKAIEAQATIVDYDRFVK